MFIEPVLYTYFTSRIQRRQSKCKVFTLLGIRYQRMTNIKCGSRFYIIRDIYIFILRFLGLSNIYLYRWEHWLLSISRCKTFDKLAVANIPERICTNRTVFVAFGEFQDIFYTNCSRSTSFTSKYTNCLTNCSAHNGEHCWFQRTQHGIYHRTQRTAGDQQ